MTRGWKIGLSSVGALVTLTAALFGVVYLFVSSVGSALAPSRDPSIVMKEVPCAADYGGGRCGVITAPLDYRGRDPSVVQVGFIFYPAVSPFAEKTRVAQLVSGGPGLSMSGYMENPLFAYTTRFKFRRTALLVIDARGVGLSARLLCSNATKDQGAGAALNANVVAACAKEAGSARIHYNTENAVRDYSLVKRALGIEKIDLIGFSYGTNASVVYAALFPKDVRSLILDSPYTLKNKSLAMPDFIAAVKRQFASACKASKQCTADSSWTALEKVVADLRVAPRPLKLPKRNYRLPHNPMLDVRQLAVLTRFMPGSLDDKHYYPLLGAVLDAAAGKWQKLENIAVINLLFVNDPEFSEPDNGSGFSFAMSRAVDCAEVDLAWDVNVDVPTRRLQLAKARADADVRGEVQPFTAEEWTSLQDPRLGCLLYPAPPRGYEAEKRYAKLNQLPVNLPVLMMSGDLDMNAPLESAEALHSLIKSAQFARFRYDEHLVIPANSCGFDMAVEFLDELHIENPSRCIESGKLVLDIHNLPPILKKYLAGEPLG